MSGRIARPEPSCNGKSENIRSAKGGKLDQHSLKQGLQICHSQMLDRKFVILRLGKNFCSFIVHPSATLARGMRCVSITHSPWCPVFARALPSFKSLARIAG
ncbi:hypothetical protein [Brucella cytisi]|uniref:hypothetical protein n=1 Tax=Brucella cytisi TaxID=407152 RepID=UPI00142E2998|nr:hypothetical protein [Brucella cytisi]